MQIKRGIVLGSGKLALACAKRIKEAGVPAELYDTGDLPSAFLKSGAWREGISYQRRDFKEVCRELQRAQEETLLVSAINPEILPSSVVEQPLLYAVNCHQALLPRHPGRNAEMWALIEGDEQTGITWHELTAGVDEGGILLQKAFAISETDTSYTIFREQIRLAEEGFRELLPKLLAGTARSYPQEVGVERVLHYSWETPNGGILDPGWSGEQISRFLRGMDYGILPVVARPSLWYQGHRYFWKKYRIIREKSGSEEVKRDGDTLIIQKENMRIDLCRVFEEPGLSEAAGKETVRLSR